jgi:PD-(D/E)XK nuclease superfamily
MQLQLSDLPRDGIPDTIPINASGLKISSCPRRWFFAVYLGLKPSADEGIPLVVGKLIHKFAENVAIDRSPMNWQQQCLNIFREAREKDLPLKDQEQIKKALSACPVQDLPRPLPLDEKNGVELKFTVKHPDYPNVNYMGTIDLLTRKGDVLQVIDIKTTRKYAFKDALAGYEGDTQFTFYPWILNKFAYDLLPHEIANLAWYRHMTMHALIVQIALPTPSWRLGPAQSFTDEAFKEFGALLHDQIEILYRTTDTATARNIIPPASGKTNNSCPSCPFKRLCFAKDAVSVELFLSETKVVKYEPLSW